MPSSPSVLRRARVVVLPVVALVALGAVTGLLGTSVHLARTVVLGVAWPTGLVLAVSFVVCVDLAAAAATSDSRRVPVGRALLAMAAGRGLGLLLVLFPTPEGDVVVTGAPASTVWILLAVLVPAFAAPLVSARAVVRAHARRPARPAG